MKITLTPEDMMKGEPHREGWVKASIISTSAAPNKAQDGVNYNFSFKIENDPDNRTIDKIFSSKAMGFIKPFLAAIKGVSMSEFIEQNKLKGIEFEPEGLVNSKLQIKIGNRIYEGRPVSEVQDFAPYDTQVPF